MLRLVYSYYDIWLFNEYLNQLVVYFVLAEELKVGISAMVASKESSVKTQRVDLKARYDEEAKKVQRKWDCWLKNAERDVYGILTGIIKSFLNFDISQ